jgi:hypothetical protein
VQAEDSGELFADCVEMRLGERVLIPTRAEALPVGGAAYLYRVLAKEKA